MKKQDHNTEYDLLQKKYELTHDKKILAEMYLICIEITGNYINKICRKKGLILDQEILVENASTWIIEYYLKKPNFHINRISAYAYFAAIKALWKDAALEQTEISYDLLEEKNFAFNNCDFDLEDNNNEED